MFACRQRVEQQIKFTNRESSTNLLGSKSWSPAPDSSANAQAHGGTEIGVIEQIPESLTIATIAMSSYVAVKLVSTYYESEQMCRNTAQEE